MPESGSTRPDGSTAVPDGGSSEPDAGQAPWPARVVVCGKGLFTLDMEADPPNEVWRWDPDASGLPSTTATQLSTMAECKPLEGGYLGLASNSGGVAIIERQTGRAIFHANVRNAHSIELLPGGLVVVAAASDRNRLVLFDIKRSADALSEIEFASAHGVVWDTERERLWAVGKNSLIRFALQPRTMEGPPQLRVDESYDLPNRGGHDLRADPVSDDLILSTGLNVWRFNRTAEKFTPHPALGDARLVKGVDVHPDTGQTAYVRALNGTWYSDEVSFLGPDDEVALQEDRPYKVRWLPPL